MMTTTFDDNLVIFSVRPYWPLFKQVVQINNKVAPISSVFIQRSRNIFISNSLLTLVAERVEEVE